MKIPLGVAIAGALAASALSGIAAAHAQGDYNYPVCLHVYGPVTYDDCRYTSLAQCAPAAVGRSAQCMTNPFYVPAERRPIRRY